MATAKFVFKRPSELTPEQWRVLKGQALGVLENATPKDTGDLRSSWSTSGAVRTDTRRSITIITDDAVAPYAQYVDKGESPHPTLSAKQKANVDFTKRASVRLGDLANVLKR